MGRSRFVAATSRDLEAEVAAGRFRPDLYYRVNVVRLHLPPLRERREDIPELVHHFVALYNGRFKLAVTGVTPAAMRALMDYAWPGNVRELENVVERALVLTEGMRIEADQLPAAVRDAGAPPLALSAPGSPAADSLDLSIKRGVEALERDLISRALARTVGNRTRAAQLLEISHRALLYKIRDYGLDGGGGSGGTT